MASHFDKKFIEHLPCTVYQFWHQRQTTPKLFYGDSTRKSYMYEVAIKGQTIFIMRAHSHYLPKSKIQLYFEKW